MNAAQEDADARRVVLATHDSPLARLLASELLRAQAIDEVWIERRRPSMRFLWRRLRRVGFTDFVFQVWLQHWFARRMRQCLPPIALPAHRSIVTVNDETIPPNVLLLGFGTSVITRATLARSPHGILNLHTGALPAFRGVKSELWTFLEEEYGLKVAGWTVHFMAPALDAGDVVLAGSVPLRTALDPAHLRVLLVRDAIPQIASLLHRFRSGLAVPSTPQDPLRARYFSTPTLRQWLQWRRWSARRHRMNLGHLS